MRRSILLLAILFTWAVSALSQENDSLPINHFVTRSTLVGVGYTQVLDTYLSPAEYTGIEGRFLHERMRMTKLFGGRVSTQSMVQSNLAYTENRSGSGSEFSGMVNWTYGLHYHFPINGNLRILVGGLGDGNLGFIYNTRNSNNPVQAKAYINLTASAMAFYKFRIGRRPFSVRYQVNVPFIGAMFSPGYQQSYYEIFTLGNHDKVVRFTSLHNQPSMRQLLTLDIPVGGTTLRVGYLGDYQQSKVNNIRCHTYSHAFMVGFVKNFYLIKHKDPLRKQLPF